MDSESILILALAVAIIAFRVLPNILGKKNDPGGSGDYGMLGGVVCPNCGLPYKLTLGSIRLGFGSLNRCPHCGKWRVVRRATPEALGEAEGRLKGENKSKEEKPKMSEEEKLRRELDTSRYED